MEFVEGYLGVGQMFRHAFDESGAHVDANLGDLIRIATMRGQVFGESRDRGGVLAFGDMDDASFVDIDEQRDIIVTTPRGGFIDRHPGDAGCIDAGAGFLDGVRSRT